MMSTVSVPELAAEDERLQLHSRYHSDGAPDGDWTKLASSPRTRVLGRGRTAEVFLSEFDGTKFAVKTARRPTHRKQVLEESRLLEHLSHPHIVTQFGLATLEDGVHLIIEYAERGTVKEFLESDERSSLNVPLLLRWSQQLASALSYLHSERILHLDVKPGNILITDQRTIKLCDFGSAKLLDDLSSVDPFDVGTLEFVAPEILSKQRFDTSADIYSMGVTLWCMMTGRMPYDDIDSPATRILYIKEGGWFEFPLHSLAGDVLPPSYRNMARLSVSRDPSSRGTLAFIELVLKRLLSTDNAPSQSDALL